MRYHKSHRIEQHEQSDAICVVFDKISGDGAITAAEIGQIRLDIEYPSNGSLH